MKKIVGSKKGVGGATGEAEVVEEFRKVYIALYNSSDTSDDLYDLKLTAEISDGSIVEADKITGKIVKEAACRMKPKKSDISQSFTSDAIRNAPDNFFDYIALIYIFWLIHGTATLSLISCAFLPLFKGGLKDPAQTDSYTVKKNGMSIQLNPVCTGPSAIQRITIRIYTENNPHIYGWSKK